MVTLINYNGGLKRMLQPFLKKIAVRLPTIFEIGAPIRIVEPKTRSQVAGKKTKTARIKKQKVYHLFGEGAYGGLVLRAALVFKGGEGLFESIQAANLHASDIFMPERVVELKRVIKTKRFRQQGEVDKSELNSNK
jgi:hypothetical protein